MMDYLRGSENRYRTPAFNAWMKPSFSKQISMPSVSNCVVLDNYSFQSKHGMEQFPSTKFFQPPPFLVGGFVGSKVCDKNGPVNYSNVLARIITSVTSLTPIHTPRKSYGEENWQRKPMSVPKICPKVTSPMKSECHNPDVVISSPKVTQQTVLPVSPPIMPNQQEIKLSPCRTISESSENSWASISPAEEKRNVLLSNPWLSNIVVCVSDSDDADDSSSEWDEVDDFQSENGEVIRDFKWNGDSLSPISSPVSRTPPVSAAALDDYDSDESDGVLICCGHGYVVDAEEEIRERKLAEERIQDANSRWNQQMSVVVDQTDGNRKKMSKQVHFPADRQLTRVRPMLTWTHAHRAARKGDWERFARDADRFRERIDTSAAVLSRILDPLHRDRIRQRNLKYDTVSETI